MKIVAVLDVDVNALKEYDNYAYGKSNSFSLRDSFIREMGWCEQSGITLDSFTELREKGQVC